MLVRCICNELGKIKSLATRNRLKRAIHLDGPDYELEVGRVYPVQAIEVRDAGVWVFIHTDIHGNCPYPYPLEFFEVVDSSIPASWEVSFVDRGDGCEFNRISFAEWAADDDFYERLVDEDVKCAETYLAKMRE